jgi:hypothetical protein
MMPATRPEAEQGTSGSAQDLRPIGHDNAGSDRKHNGYVKAAGPRIFVTDETTVRAGTDSLLILYLTAATA